MRGSVAAAFVLVACHTSGVDVVVTAPDGTAVDSIVLYLGDGSGSQVVLAPQGAPDGFSLMGTASQHDVPDLSCSSCRPRVRFTYEAGANVQDIGDIIAIASSGQSIVAAAHSGPVAVPHDRIVTVPLDLAAVNVLFPAAKTAPAAAPLVEVWHADPMSGADETCALYDDPTLQAASFVSYVDPNIAVDQDCDGYATGGPLECDPNRYMASMFTRELGGINGARDAMVGGMSTCLLTGPSCVDGKGNDMFGDTAYCVPKSACDACGATPGGPATPDTVLACLENSSAIIAMTAMPRIECAVEYNSSLGGFCGGSSSVSLPFTNAALQCKDAQLVDRGTWGSSFDVAGAPVSVAAQGPCTVTFGVLHANAIPPGDLVTGSLLAMTVDNGMPGPRGAAVPVTFHVVNLTFCSNGLSCTATTSLSSAPDLGPCLSTPAPPDQAVGN